MTSKHRPVDRAEADDAAHQRAIKRMQQIDALPSDIRALIHEHGYTIVKAFLDCGVKQARHIQHLICTVREGSHEVGKRLEKLQISNGLSPHEYAVVPIEPTNEMIEAGLLTTATFLSIQGSALTVNREKMRRRYRAMVLKAAGRC